MIFIVKSHNYYLRLFGRLYEGIRFLHDMKYKNQIFGIFVVWSLEETNFGLELSNVGLLDCWWPDGEAFQFA